MTDLPTTTKTQRVLELPATDHNLHLLESVTKALASNTRLEILRFLGAHTCSVSEIAEALSLPQSTANLHINILEKAGLIRTNLQSASRGVQRVCARMYDQITIQIPITLPVEEGVLQVQMPIGAYVDAVPIPTCGLLSETGYVGVLDNPAAFFEPSRIYAQLLWFHRGYVEYRFPNHLPTGAHLDSLELSFEACSEAPLHHPDWRSDITVWINDVEIGTWTSPADFGGEPGNLTPAWWSTNNTQYGLLKVWKVTSQGSFIDGNRISPVTIDLLKVPDNGLISVRIGIKEDAVHIGGLNLFGSQFGNYPQDIVLTHRYHYQAEASSEIEPEE